MDKQTYPTLKVTELIVGYKEEMGINLTIEMFNNPNPDLWQQVFLRIAAKVFRLQPMDLHEILRSVSEKVEHFELYEISLVNVRLTFLIQKLLINIGCPYEFNLVSLRKPEKKELVNFLSPILNFVRFQAMQAPDIEEMLAKEKVEMDKNILLKEKVQQLKQQIAGREKELEELKKIEQSDSNEYNKLVEVVKVKKGQVEVLIQKKKKIDAVKAELVSLLDKKTAHREELKDRMKSALSRTVQSPMRLQQDIQNYKDMHPGLQREYDDLKAEYWKVKEEVKRLTVASEEMQRLSEGRRKEIEAIFHDNKAKKQTISQNKANMEEMAKRQKDLEQQFHRLEALGIEKREKLMKMEGDEAHQIGRMVEFCNQLEINTTKKDEMIAKKKKEIKMHSERRDFINQQIEGNREKAKAMCCRIVKSVEDYQVSARKELSLITRESIDKEVELKLARLDKADK